MQDQQQDERALVVAVNEAKAELDRADKVYSEAYHVHEKARANLIQFMTDRDITSTAKYEGIGSASLDKPELFARVNEPDRESLFVFLKETGRDDLIKSSVHHKSLSGFVTELLELGKGVPEFIKYGFKQTLKMRKA